MLEHHTCVTARCDECGQLYGENAGGGLYFNTMTDALEEITTSYGDEVTWVVGDDARLRCDRCEIRRLCTEHGHDWSLWLHCLCQGVNGQCLHAERYCDRCLAHESTHSTSNKEASA
ncbi:hypothetical protein ACH347_43315 [Saccharopolyspora sp. 5N102]|uniref:hypothetical protein n=1 Tax=Saccharopolyspora sp. 5N102 TaxID=3375155 RepID=UPI00379CF1C1